jgi:hypothetical protein
MYIHSSYVLLFLKKGLHEKQEKGAYQVRRNVYIMYNVPGRLALYMMYIRAGHRGRRRRRKNLRMLSLVDYSDGYTMEVAHGNRLVLRPTKYAYFS